MNERTFEFPESETHTKCYIHREYERIKAKIKGKRFDGKSIKVNNLKMMVVSAYLTGYIDSLDETLSKAEDISLDADEEYLKSLAYLQGLKGIIRD